MPTPADASRRKVPCQELLPLVEEAIRGGATVRITATGNSMLPFIGHGDAVELQPLGRAPLRRGDVVLARVAQGAYVLHRVVKARGTVVTLKGDALSNCDPPLPADGVVARAVCAVRGDLAIPLGTAPYRLLALALGRLLPLLPRRFRPGLRASNLLFRLAGGLRRR
jgi:signal peptidase